MDCVGVLVLFFRQLFVPVIGQGSTRAAGNAVDVHFLYTRMSDKLWFGRPLFLITWLQRSSETPKYTRSIGILLIWKLSGIMRLTGNLLVLALVFKLPSCFCEFWVSQAHFATVLHFYSRKPVFFLPRLAASLF